MRRRPLLILLLFLIIGMIAAVSWAGGVPGLAGETKQDRPTEFTQLGAAQDLVREPLDSEPDQANSHSGATNSIGSASIHCQVLGPYDQAMESIRVELSREDVAVASGISNSQGKLAFSGLEPGEYRLYIQGPLAEGLLMPWRQKQRTSWTGMSKIDRSIQGYYATQVRLAPEDQAETILRVFRSAGVSGAVIGPAGEPIEKVAVRIGSRVPGLEGLSQDTDTDSRGLFVFSQVYPGPYTAQIWLHNSEDAYRKMTLPIPLDFQVSEDSDPASLLIQVEEGPHRVWGRVLNQDAKPVKDMRVFICLDRNHYDASVRTTWGDTVAGTLTDEEGRYLLSGLKPSHYQISIGTDQDYDRLLNWVKPLEVDIRAAQVGYDLGDTEVIETRPFTLQGRLILRTEGLQMNQVQLAFAECSVVDAVLGRAGSEVNSAARVRAPRELRPRGMLGYCQPEENGDYLVKLRVPGPAVYLLVYVGREILRVIPVDASPLGSGSLDIIL